MTDDGLLVGEMELSSEGFSFQEQRHPMLVIRPHLLQKTAVPGVEKSTVI